MLTDIARHGGHGGQVTRSRAGAANWDEGRDTETSGDSGDLSPGAGLNIAMWQ